MKVRKAYSVAGVVLLVELFLQFYFAAGGIFMIASKADENATVVKGAVHNSEAFFGLHAANGTILIPLTILVMIGLSFWARYPWRTTGLTALLFGLLVIQFALAAAGFAGVAVIAGLHGLNALVMVGANIYVVVRNWAFGRPARLVGEAAQPAVGAPFES